MHNHALRKIEYFVDFLVCGGVRKMFAVFLGLSLLAMGLIPLLSACFMLFTNQKRDALRLIPGALLVLCVLGFIGYNTVAVELGLASIP